LFLFVLIISGKGNTSDWADITDHCPKNYDFQQMRPYQSLDPPSLALYPIIDYNNSGYGYAYLAFVAELCEIKKTQK
jgi:hypothetical protein